MTARGGLAGSPPSIFFMGPRFVKTTRKRPKDAVALTQEEAETIAEDCGVSAGECWICEMFVQKLRKDKDGFFLLPEALEDDGLVEHLRQIIGRDVDEEPLAQSC